MRRPTTPTPARRLRPRPALTAPRGGDRPRRRPGRDVARLFRLRARPPAASPPAKEAAVRRLTAGPAGRRGSASRGAGLVWRMTSDQAPVLWPFIAAPGLPPTGAQMGIDVLSGGSFYADPFGWVLRDDVPVTNPNVICFGKPGRGKSATTKAFLPADDGLRVPHPDPGRPQGRVRTAVHLLRGRAVPHRPGPARPDQPPGVRAARPGWDTLDGQERAHPRRDRVRALADPDARPWSAPNASAPTPVPFGPVEETVVKAALRDLTGYTTGATHLVETTIPALWHQLDQPTPP
jgi:hypothetical protein